MLITFNKSGSLANIDFQYDSFSQGDNNVHIINVIIDDESFNNLDYNGYVQFLREGETTPSPKLIMTHTEKGYKFKMNTDWYTAISGTLKMTIEIKQYDENGLQSNKAFGVVNIPVMESVSGISEVETTITNEEYLALVNSLNEKANLKAENTFTGKTTFNNGVHFNSVVNFSNMEDSDYVEGQRVAVVYTFDEERNDEEFKIEIPAKDGVVAFTSDIPELPTDPDFASIRVGVFGEDGGPLAYTKIDKDGTLAKYRGTNTPSYRLYDYGLTHGTNMTGFGFNNESPMISLNDDSKLYFSNNRFWGPMNYLTFPFKSGTIALTSDIPDKLVSDKNLGFGFNGGGQPTLQLNENRVLGISRASDNFDSPLSIKFPTAQVDGVTTLVAEENLKTINGKSLIGSGDIELALLNDIPKKVSQLTNDSGYLTNQNAYNKTEINDLLSTVSSLKFEVVSNLPTTNISISTIYLKPIGDIERNLYEEYIYINNKWELLGNTQIDLSNYYKKTETYSKNEIDSKVNEKADVSSVPTRTSQLQNDSNFLVNGQGAKHKSITLDKGDTNSEIAIHVKRPNKESGEEGFLADVFEYNESSSISEESMLFGDWESNLAIKSKNKPKWSNGTEVVEFATMDDLDISLKTDPSFKSVTVVGGSLATTEIKPSGVKVDGGSLVGSASLGATGINFGANNEYTGLGFMNLQGSDPTMLVGNNQSILNLYSSTRPWWIGANGEGGQLATMDDIQNGGLPTNPEFESVILEDAESGVRTNIDAYCIQNHCGERVVDMNAEEGLFSIYDDNSTFYGNGYIGRIVDGENFNLYLPNKQGTLATLDDIGTSGGSGSALDENGNLVFDGYNQGIVFDALTSSPSIYINEDNDYLEISPSTNFQSQIEISNKDNEFYRTYIDNMEVSVIDDDNPAGVSIANDGRIYGYFIDENNSFHLSGDEGSTFRYGDSETFIGSDGITTTEIKLYYDDMSSNGSIRYNASEEAIEVDSLYALGSVGVEGGIYTFGPAEFYDDVIFRGNVNFGNNLIASGSFTSNRILFDKNLIQADKTYMIIIKGPFQEVGWVSSTAIIRTSQFSGNYIYGETTLSWYEENTHPEIFKLYLFSSDNGNGLDYDYVTSTATSGILSGNDYTYEIRLLPY